MPPLLEIEELVTQIPTKRGLLTAVDHVSFSVERGEVFGLVGESGCGKSMTCRSILGLVPKPGKVVSGHVRFDGQDMLGLSKAELTALRGRQLAMIFQDATAALNPVLRIGTQLREAMLEHRIVTNVIDADARAVELMRMVGIPAPKERLRDYAHQFSGGMCQRVVIACALACYPRIILADEPTTALDVTIQDQILKLLVSLQSELELSLVLVTHDMGVVAQTCQRVAVMYAGQIVEMASTTDSFAAPRHPYTIGLLNCVPRMDESGEVYPLRPIPGSPPDLVKPPSGCRFHPRCPLASEECKSGAFPLRAVGDGHFSSCIKHEQLAQSTDIWPTGLPMESFAPLSAPSLTATNKAAASSLSMADHRAVEGGKAIAA